MCRSVHACACVYVRACACVHVCVYITQQPLESIIFIDQRENNKNENDAEQILKKITNVVEHGMI